MTKRTLRAALAPFLLAPLLATAQDNETAELVGPQQVPVANAVTEQDTGGITEEQLLEEFAHYRRMLQSGTLDEADIAAKRIVEMAIRIYGPQSRETASALNNLGIVQHGNSQFDAAIQNFTSAVEILETVEDRLNGALVNPLKGLGAAQLGNNRPDLAISTFSRAAHITHVNEGPHNTDQIEILESIAETHIRMGDKKTARKTLDRIHVINAKKFQQNPLGLLPSLMNRATWQHRAGYFAEERATYRRAIRIVESGASNNDPRLIEPLRRLGESYYFVDMSMATPQQQGLVSTGEMYFKRATRIAERTEGYPWRDVVQTQIALADYYTFTEAQNRARKIYRKVWAALSEDEYKIEFRDQLLGQPVPIRVESLPRYAGGKTSMDDTLQAGSIVVTFDVSSRGRVRELVTEANPEEFTDIQRMVHREVRRRIYRPRLEEGEAVDSIGVVFEHPFSYSQQELQKLQLARAAAAEAAAREAEQEDRD